MSAFLDMGASAPGRKAVIRNHSGKFEPSCLPQRQDEGAALFPPSPKGTPPQPHRARAPSQP